MPELKELLETVPHVGKVEWIGTATARRGEIETHQAAEIEMNVGLVADHHARSGKSKRQVTLIQQEHLGAIAKLLGRDSIDPTLLRRNIVVSGVNLLSLKHARFQIGEVVLEGTGPCAPCSLMEENLGPGGYSAMRGHGGITTVVVKPGTIRVGDEVKFLELAAVEEKPV
ncbi:MAG: MOSC domain-containing protein [Planctomycetaceae bacterium]|nr:MOSC domain-containing protein [Planctomycetaceae bacterium]